MFASGQNETVIAEGLRIEGKVAADGTVRLHGHVTGDLHCSSLIVSEKAAVAGTIVAETVVVDGTVEGPIRGGDVVLKAHAHVTGDIHHKSLSIEKGARFDGRSKQDQANSGDAAANGKKPAKPTTRGKS